MSLAPRAFLLVLCLITELHTTAAHAAATGDFAGLVDIGGGRKLYVECRGVGSPAVILVAGLRGSAEEWTSADKSLPAVFPEVAKFTRVCAYDCPGTPVGEQPSRSEPGRSRLLRWMRSPICTPCCAPKALRALTYLSGTLTVV